MMGISENEKKAWNLKTLIEAFIDRIRLDAFTINAERLHRKDWSLEMVIRQFLVKANDTIIFLRDVLECVFILGNFLNLKSIKKIKFSSNHYLRGLETFLHGFLCLVTFFEFFRIKSIVETKTLTIKCQMI